jgi:K+-sensing histidine kinase KdpD
MKRQYETYQTLKLVFILIAIAIVMASMYFTNSLVKKLSVEERRKMEIWAEATRQLVSMGEETNIEFALKIIEGNITIPVVMVDEKDNLSAYRNIAVKGDDEATFFAKKIAEFKAKHPPIPIVLEDNSVQYIYYDDSLLIKQLAFFPYVQLGIIAVFLAIAFLAFSSTKRAEQNQVWVGLFKETAHQLGTPISSLLAWVEIFKSKHVDETLMNEMQKDVNRLRIIAERFSKIGSKPELIPVDLNQTLQNAVQYIRNRSSKKVKIETHVFSGQQVMVPLNVPLFEWVIENLCKNAIDAMDGEGNINISITELTANWCIDVQDTGKGIPKSKFKTVFSPGYTTKSRGWGLGLSLVKRIVEEYHSGKIVVKHSEIGIGTTFRILLNK